MVYTVKDGSGSVVTGNGPGNVLGWLVQRMEVRVKEDSEWVRRRFHQDSTQFALGSREDEF